MQMLRQPPSLDLEMLQSASQSVRCDVGEQQLSVCEPVEAGCKDKAKAERLCTAGGEQKKKTTDSGFGTSQP